MNRKIDFKTKKFGEVIELDFLRRLNALIRKEFQQVKRDNSTILIGAVLPMVLIVLIGYGISLDVKRVPIAVVLEDTSPTARHSLNFLNGSQYYSAKYVYSMREAENLMRERQIEAILRVSPTFSADLMRGEAKLQLILYGADSATATTVQGYVEGAIRQLNGGKIVIESRMWFNDTNSSTWYFVPGLMMLISTIVGVFLTALVMAREWERGTLEAIFVTPVRLIEILLAKMIPYFFVAMFGFILCLMAAKYLYKLPIHGSLAIILFSSVIYLFVSLGIGLLISTITKSQFLSAQVSLIVSFMPALMLTGFIFDLRSVPEFISRIGHALPPTYYLELLKSLFLAGNNWTMIAKNCSILILYAIFFVVLALKVTRKRVE